MLQQYIFRFLLQITLQDEKQANTNEIKNSFMDKIITAGTYNLKFKDQAKFCFFLNVNDDFKIIKITYQNQVRTDMLKHLKEKLANKLYSYTNILTFTFINNHLIIEKDNCSSYTMKLMDENIQITIQLKSIGLNISELNTFQQNLYQLQCIDKFLVKEAGVQSNQFQELFKLDNLKDFAQEFYQCIHHKDKIQVIVIYSIIINQLKYCESKFNYNVKKLLNQDRVNIYLQLFFEMFKQFNIQQLQQIIIKITNDKIVNEKRYVQILLYFALILYYKKCKDENKQIQQIKYTNDQQQPYEDIFSFCLSMIQNKYLILQKSSLQKQEVKYTDIEKYVDKDVIYNFIYFYLNNQLTKDTQIRQQCFLRLYFYEYDNQKDINKTSKYLFQILIRDQEHYRGMLKGGFKVFYNNPIKLALNILYILNSVYPQNVKNNKLSKEQQLEIKQNKELFENTFKEYQKHLIKYPYCEMQRFQLKEIVIYVIQLLYLNQNIQIQIPEYDIYNSIAFNSVLYNFMTPKQKFQFQAICKLLKADISQLGILSEEQLKDFQSQKQFKVIQKQQDEQDYQIKYIKNQEDVDIVDTQKKQVTIENNDICCICFSNEGIDEQGRKTVLSTLPCGHVICQDCIKQMQNNQCPMCRKPYEYTLVKGKLDKININNDYEYVKHLQKLINEIGQKVKL